MHRAISPRGSVKNLFHDMLKKKISAFDFNEDTRSTVFKASDLDEYSIFNYSFLGVGLSILETIDGQSPRSKS